MKVVPATIERRPAAPVVNYAAFDEFAKLGDRLVVKWLLLLKTTREVGPSFSKNHLNFAQDILGSYKPAEVARFEEQSKIHEPDESWDDNGGLKRSEVSKRVAVLVGSFPNSNVRDPEVYVRMLIEELIAAGPTAVTLEAACRAIRRTSKFIPTISEMLTELHNQDKRWSDIWMAAQEIGEVADDLRALITAETERRAAIEHKPAAAMDLTAFKIEEPAR